MRTKSFLLLLLYVFFFLNGKMTAQDNDVLQHIRLMTYNIHNGTSTDNTKSYQRIADVISQAQADVVAVQEVDSVTERSEQTDVLLELATLTGMHHTYAPAIALGGGKYGIGILSREEPAGFHYVPLPGREEARVMLLVEFSNYVFCNAHISLTAADQLLSLPIIKEEVAKFTDKPVFFAGDFNAEPDSPFILGLTEDFKILTNTKWYTYPSSYPQGTIDYITIANKDSQNYTTVSSRTISTQASDHLPVVADIAHKDYKVPGFDRLLMTFEEYYKENTIVTPENYAVGTNPGCISQELYDVMLAAYNEAVDFTGRPGLDDSEYNRAADNIIKSFERYDKERVKLVPGYYLIVSQRSQDAMYDKGSVAYTTLGMAKPENWSPETAKYIWEVQAAADNRFYLKNVGTKRYLGPTDGNRHYLTSEDPQYSYVMPNFKSDMFLIKDPNHYTHCQADAVVVWWDDATHEGNHWKFDIVDPIVVDTLQEKIDQKLLNDRLSSIHRNAQKYLNEWKYKNGITFDGGFTPSERGLVTKIDSSNSIQKGEGSPAYLFDNKLDTYFHTIWSESGNPDDYDWIQVDLSKELQEVYIKFAYRHNNMNGRPTHYFIVAADDDDLDAPIWGDTLLSENIVCDYDTPYPGGIQENSTYLRKVTLKRPARYIRFVVDQTAAGGKTPNGKGPYWHLGELRFFDPADCVENPRLAMIPETVRKALDDAMTRATAELEAGTATAATCDELEAALEAYVKAYPDPAPLESEINAAQNLHNSSDDSQQVMGYYRTGAKEALQATIDEVKAQTTGKYLSLEELSACSQQLKTAVANFYDQLITPVPGKIYRLLSASTTTTILKGSCIVAMNADTASTLLWRYNSSDDDISYRFNTLWKLEKSEEGFALRNISNGLYLKNMYYGMDAEGAGEGETGDGYIHFSEEPSYFKMEQATYFKGGTFLLTLLDNENGSKEYLNCHPSGKVTHYFNPSDPHAPFYFEEVTEDNYYNSYTVEAPANKTMIATLPFDVDAAYTMGYEAMKVLGITEDNEIMLISYGGEPIPAGTPFFIKTEEEEEYFTVDMPFYTLEECLDITYNRQPVTVNGLVSAPNSVVLKKGQGYLSDDDVIFDESSTTVDAGSGYFTIDIPKTDEEGDYILKANYTFDPSGIGEVNISKNEFCDVYTLSGVLLRKHVRKHNATKGLPKGIYIVGGEKVAVK